MLVLWVIVVLGAVALGVVGLSRAETSRVATARARAVGRYAAESGIVATRTQLRELIAAAATPEAGTRVFPDFERQQAAQGVQTLGSARYQVAIVDLNARVDLNASGRAVILGLLDQFVDARKAEELVEALRDWTDEDEVPSPYGGEAPEYLASGSPFLPPNRPLLRLDELPRIRGFTDSLALVLAPYVTVHGDGRVNVNTAPRPVLAAVLGAGGVHADLFAPRRQGAKTFETLAAVRDALAPAGGDAAGAQAGALTTVPSRVLIISRGWEEGRPLTHEIQAVFSIESVAQDGGVRLELRHWIERDL
jgi:general secretion pathway protein K